MSPPRAAGQWTHPPTQTAGGPEESNMNWNRVSADEVAPMAWRNGGGRTRELLVWPQAADWTLRISVADIEQEGPFSTFPGVDRWFAVLSGAGVQLMGQVLRPGDDPIRFDGELAPACALLDGPTQDFNAMHRREHGRLRLVPAAEPLLPTGVRWLGLFTERGGLLTHGARAVPLAPRTLAWCEQPAAHTCLFTAVDETEGLAWWLAWSDT